MKAFPESFRKCMEPQERKRLGQLTNEETATEKEREGELELHEQFISFLRRNSLGYYHTNPSRKSTIKRGMPDFGVYDESRIVWIEFKVGHNDLSPVQKVQIAEMVSRKNVVFVCHEYPTAVELTTKFFHLRAV